MSAPAGGSPAAEVDALPLRVAQVAYALIARWKDNGGMVTTAEVCEYDETALSVAATRSALYRARALRLADGYAGLWFPTNAAHKLCEALEDRVLRACGR